MEQFDCANGTKVIKDVDGSLWVKRKGDSRIPARQWCDSPMEDTATINEVDTVIRTLELLAFPVRG